MGPAQVPTDRFRFRPAHPVRVAVVGLLGAGLVIASAITGAWGWAALGGLGVLVAAVYFASPAWRIALEVDDQHLTVRARAAVRFRLPLGDLRLREAPRGGLYVDGGSPDRSVLVPGRRARVPYRIERQADLIALLRARVPDA